MSLPLTNQATEKYLKELNNADTYEKFLLFFVSNREEFIRNINFNKNIIN